MNLTKCNKCDFVSRNSALFTEVYVYLPVRKNRKSLSEKWSEEERLLEETDLIYAGLKEPAQKDYDNGICIHLCPKCTAWFDRQFYVKKRVGKRSRCPRRVGKHR